MFLIKNALVYAPEPLGRVDVLVIGGKVVQIGGNLRPNIDGIEVIDANDKILIPGIIDQHVHVTGGGGEGGLHTRTPEITLSRIIESGVTTVFGLLGTDSFTRDIENLVAKTRGLKNEGISAYCYTGAYRYPSCTLTGDVAKDIIFIDEIVGGKIAMADHRGSHPTAEEIIRLASDIRMAGLVGGKAGVLHIHMGATAGGMEFLMDLIKSNDIPAWNFRPTHLGRAVKQASAFTHMGGYADITAKVGMFEDFLEIVENSVPEYITLSSDSNGSFPKWNERKEIIGIGVADMRTLFDTIRTLVKEYGVPLENALTYVTINVARAQNLYPRKGTIKVFSDADLVLLNEDLQIEGVFANGRPMMLNGEMLVRGTFE